MSQSVSPPALRGHFYPTAFIARCDSYHHCRRCSQCANYNPQNAICTECESRKRYGRPCQCTQAERFTLIQLEKKLDRPVFDRNAEAGSQVLFQTDHEHGNQDLVQELLGQG
jgi:hypothetical protein